MRRFENKAGNLSLPVCNTAKKDTVGIRRQRLKHDLCIKQQVLVLVVQDLLPAQGQHLLTLHALGPWFKSV